MNSEVIVFRSFVYHRVKLFTYSFKRNKIKKPFERGRRKTTFFQSLDSDYIRKQPAVIVCSLQPKAILNLQDFHAYSIQFLVWIIMVFEGYVWDRMRGVTAEACDVGGCPQILLMAALGISWWQVCSCRRDT